MYTCDVAGWNIMDYVATENFTVPSAVKVTRQTSPNNIDLVVNGLVHLGVKKTKAKKIVKMCNNKCYDDPQDLFVACFPHINS